MPWTLAKDVPRSQNESFQEGYQINIVNQENCGKLPFVFTFSQVFWKAMQASYMA